MRFGLLMALSQSSAQPAHACANIIGVVGPVAVCVWRARVCV